MTDNNNENETTEQENLYPETETLKEEVQKQKEELQTQEELLKNTDEENEWAEEIFRNDLESVKKEFPFVEATHISQLGENFLSLMSVGQQNGLSAVDAYAATHRNEIFAQTQKVAKQEALTKLASKAHMKPVLGIGGMSEEVPKSVYEKYKRLMPGISDSEIRKHYISSKED